MTSQPLAKPLFVVIVAAASIAIRLTRRYGDDIYGFVCESFEGGGHVVSPRSKDIRDDGQPDFSSRDLIDIAAMRKLGKPFWLAGGSGKKGGLSQAQTEGADGVQIGSPFALCDESGLDKKLKRRYRKWAYDGKLKLFV